MKGVSIPDLGMIATKRERENEYECRHEKMNDLHLHSFPM